MTSVDAAVPLVIWFGGALFGSAATIIAFAVVRHLRESSDFADFERSRSDRFPSVRGRGFVEVGGDPHAPIPAPPRTPSCTVNLP